MTPIEPPRLKANDYHDYVGRFRELVGDIAEGQYGNYRGRLVLRMTQVQFERKYQRITCGVNFLLRNNKEQQV